MVGTTSDWKDEVGSLAHVLCVDEKLRSMHWSGRKAI
jgi:hypothetical protein